MVQIFRIDEHLHMVFPHIESLNLFIFCAKIKVEDPNLCFVEKVMLSMQILNLEQAKRLGRLHVCMK